MYETDMERALRGFLNEHYYIARMKIKRIKVACNCPLCQAGRKALGLQRVVHADESLGQLVKRPNRSKKHEDSKNPK